MDAFTRYTALAAYSTDRMSIRTDNTQAVPQEDRTHGFRQALVHDWRYLDDEETKLIRFYPQCSTLQGAGSWWPVIISAAVPAANTRLGAGGIRFPQRDRSSFADIFYNNCTKNGMAPVALKRAKWMRCSRKSRPSRVPD